MVTVAWVHLAFRDIHAWAIHIFWGHHTRSRCLPALGRGEHRAWNSRAWWHPNSETSPPPCRIRAMQGGASHFQRRTPASEFPETRYSSAAFCGRLCFRLDIYFQSCYPRICTNITFGRTSASLIIIIKITLVPRRYNIYYNGVMKWRKVVWRKINYYYYE